jgi:Rieske Fe-S protein
MNRREFIRSLIVTAALVGTAGAGLLELGNLIENNQNSQISLPTILQSNSQQSTIGGTSDSVSTQISSSSTIPTGYTLIASMSQLSDKSYAYFTHPTFGSSILVSVGGQWKAFSATCTHRPCTVQYQSSSIYCPCHAGTFNPNDGSVEGGPPPTPLPEYAVLIQNNNLYVGNTQIN